VIILCAWCGRKIREVKPQEPGVSHGICDDCGRDHFGDVWDDAFEVVEDQPVDAAE